MKVTGYGTILPTNTTRKRDGTSASASFSSFLSVASGSSAVTETVDISAPAALSSLLALQEISEEERKRERLVKRGKDMLESLDRLRSQLLMGEIPPHTLADLSRHIAQQKETFSDPRLMMIIDEIELRLAVELAKLEMAFAARAEM